MEGLGKLIYNKEKDLVFECEAEDFNDDFFGLSQIAFKPIIDTQIERADIIENNQEAPQKGKPGSASQKKSSFSYFSSFSYLMAFLFIFGWIILVDNAGQSTLRQNDFLPVKTNLNISPAKRVKKLTKIKEVAKEKETVKVIFYTFSNRKNADKILKKIEFLGYQPYKMTLNKHIKVGAELTFENKTDLNDKLMELKSKLGARSFSIEKPD